MYIRLLRNYSPTRLTCRHIWRIINATPLLRQLLCIRPHSVVLFLRFQIMRIHCGHINYIPTNGIVFNCRRTKLLVGGIMSYVAVSCTILLSAVCSSRRGIEFGYSLRKSLLWLPWTAGLLLTGSISKCVRSFGSAPYDTKLEILRNITAQIAMIQS